VELEDNKKQQTQKHIEYKYRKMNRKITVIFLSTVLPAALIAGQSGLTPDILNRANAVKADFAALRGETSRSQGMLQATPSSEAASLVNSRAGLVTDKFSSAESLMTNNPSGLNTSLSSGLTASETASLVNSRAGLMPDKFSSAGSQVANMPSGFTSSLSSGSMASEAASLVNTRAGLMPDKFSSAESLMTNVPSGLKSSLSRGSSLLEQELEQHNSLLPGGAVQ